MHFNRRCSVLVMLNGLWWGLLELFIKQSRPPILMRLPWSFWTPSTPNQLTGILSPWKVDVYIPYWKKKRISRQSCQMTYKLSIMFKGSSFFYQFPPLTFLRPRFIRAMLPTMWCGTTNSMMIQCPKLIRLVSSIVPSLGATAPLTQSYRIHGVFFWSCVFSVPANKPKSECTLPGWNFHIWRDNNSFTRVVVSRICLKECCQIHRDHHPFARETEIFLLAG